MKLKITIDQKMYEVDVEAVEPEPSPAAALRGYPVEPAVVRLPAMPPPPKAASAGNVNEQKVARSPVTGTVVRVLAQPGQSIQMGDVLLVLEAMKMETNITASNSGKLSAIKVAAGDSVSSGQVVAEFE